MTKEETLFKKENKIRHQFDEKTGEINFSISDIIEDLDLSKDPRNYWKVQKNRLKKRHNHLVSSCNQLKLLSKDGKYYKTDTANPDTLIKILDVISPSSVKEFGEFFYHMEKKYSIDTHKVIQEEEKFSTVFEEGEISVDVFLENDYLIVQAMIGGVLPEDIFVSVNYDKLIIRGIRLLSDKIKPEDFLIKELFWGKFSRTVDLPKQVDVDKVEAIFSHGLLVIKLLMLDKGRMRIVKVKNLE